MTCRRRCRSVAFTLVELLVVVGVLALLIAFLLPALNRARRTATMRMSQIERGGASDAVARTPAASGPGEAARPLASVRTFQADIVLTPRLSVGTIEPESIYEASFKATITATRASGTSGDQQIRLPLPPQVISLADLSVEVNGDPSENVMIEGEELVWRGALDGDVPVEIKVTYTAVGRGLYALLTPPGKILETFRTTLAAVGSDVRMLELSLQPTTLTRDDGRTIYTWDYKRLMYGRPIALDVLGIAPIDRLGELGWLGPLSVVVFGLIVGLVARAFAVEQFDRWMLILVLGTFTGAYPLMYFAQEFISLRTAIIGASVLVLLIIAVRTVSIMGLRLGLLGVTVPAGAILALTLTAAVRPPLQGIILTTIALGLFIAAMLLLPRLRLFENGQPDATPAMA